MQFRPRKTNDITHAAINAGQFIFDTTLGRIYIDINDTTRRLAYENYLTSKIAIMALEDFPAIGEANIMYIDEDTNNCYLYINNRYETISANALLDTYSKAYVDAIVGDLSALL